MMRKKIFIFLQNNKNKLFSWLISLYIYMLYLRGIYVGGKNIAVHIDNDYYNYVLNKQQWFLHNQWVHANLAIITGLSAVILVSLYLLYKRNRYFYAVLLFPIFGILFLLMITPIYMLLESY